MLADVRHDAVQSVHRTLADVGAEEADSILAQQHEDAVTLMQQEGVAVSGIETIHAADLLYRLLEPGSQMARDQALRACQERGYSG